MKIRLARVVGLVMVGAMVLSACASDDDTGDDTTATDDDGGDDAADDDGGDDAAGGEEFDVYALLPQGNDQPYGTTYLPPFEETAEELGLTLHKANNAVEAGMKGDMGRKKELIHHVTALFGIHD